MEYDMIRQNKTRAFFTTQFPSTKGDLLMAETFPPVPMFQVSLDTQKIQEKLEPCEFNVVVAYDELNRLIGRNVQKEARGNLNTAIYRLLRDKRIRFETIRNVGVRRIGDAAIVDAGQAGVQKIQRTSRRELDKIGCANFEKLSDGKKKEHLALSASLGATNLLSKPSSIKRIEGKATQTQETIPMADTLALFSGSDNGSK